MTLFNVTQIPINLQILKLKKDEFINKKKIRKNEQKKKWKYSNRN